MSKKENFCYGEAAISTKRYTLTIWKDLYPAGRRCAGEQSHQSCPSSLASIRTYKAISLRVSNDVGRKRKVSGSFVWLAIVQTWISEKAPPVVLKDATSISATLQFLEGLSDLEKTKRRNAKIECVAIELLEGSLDLMTRWADSIAKSKSINEVTTMLLCRTPPQHGVE